jgi:GTP:adenosylcobinamide-phosphate guanylyltransferase
VPAEAARPFTAIILAAQRSGQANPLAVEAGVSHKCLVPILGRPLIEYVLEALRAVPGLVRVRICIEPEAFDAVRQVKGAAQAEFVPSAETITESAHASAAGLDGPLLITTADNVNLTPGAVRQMLDAIASGAEAVLALATRAAVLAAHPEGQRRFYELSDDAYSNCNLYALSGAQALKAAEVFRSGGQFAKNRRRMIDAFGLFNILLFRFRLLSLDGAMKRLSRRFGMRLEAVVLADGAHAIDVDNPRTYRIAEIVLRRKAGEDA